MSVPPPVWRTLGIPPTNDPALIRRAYATKLKQTHPEDDPEAFKALRVAYETAMRLAAQRPASPPEAEGAASPAPAAAAVEAAAAEQEAAAPAIPQADPVMLELQQAFYELHDALGAPERSHDRAAKSLAVILGSPALDNVGLEQQVQYRLAELLATSTPRSDALLAYAVTRFGWSQSGLKLAPAMVHVLSRLRDLEVLEKLRSGESRYSKAFKGLCRRRLPFFRWLAAHVSRGGQRSEVELLDVLRVESPSLLPLLEPSAVAFWDKFRSQPRVSFMLVALGLMATVVLAIIGGSLQTWMPATVTGAIFAGLTLWKLYLFDWPRHHLQRKWPVGVPLWIRTGWLPIGLICLLTVATVPPVRAVTWAAMALCVVILQWTIVISHPSGSPQQREAVLKDRLLWLLGPLGLMVWWWIAVVEQLPPGAASPLAVPSFTFIGATSYGLSTLQNAWLSDLSARRRRVLLALVALTIGTSVALWLLTPRIEWRPLCVALLLGTIALHRPPATFLGRRQQIVRYSVVIGGLIALWVVLQHPLVLERTAALGGVGLVIMTSILLCLLMGLWNERRSKANARTVVPTG